MDQGRAAAARFFASPRFAVVGASTNPAKWGHRIFSWYVANGLEVTPVNPSGAALAVQGEEYSAVKSLSEVPDPKNTSLSIVTGPSITMGVLKEARELGFRAVWLQPGTFDDEVLSLAKADGAFQSVVAGPGGNGSEGWCVLMDGVQGLKDAARPSM